MSEIDYSELHLNALVVCYLGHNGHSLMPYYDYLQYALNAKDVQLEH